MMAGATGALQRDVTQDTWYRVASDPVFDNMAKEFHAFHESLQLLQAKVTAFMDSVDDFSSGLLDLSDAIMGQLRSYSDESIVSDACRIKEATTGIVCANAPHSALAKLKRNTKHNIIKPLERHLENNDMLNKKMELREQRVQQLRDAGVQVRECCLMGLGDADHRTAMATEEFNAAKRALHELDGRLFEWLFAIAEHRNDIFDSFLQTLKFLEYDLFSMAAESLSNSLPSSVEFRPMVEMTPEYLELQVEHELAMPDHDVDEDGLCPAFATRLVRRRGRDSQRCHRESGTRLPVDILSLSSLMSQGFEDGHVRRALQLHHNDTQAALNWLLAGGTAAPTDTGARKPTAVVQGPALMLLQCRRERLTRDADGPLPECIGASAVVDSSRRTTYLS